MALPANITDLVTSIQQTKTRLATSGGGNSQFLKMSKQGIFVYGAEETESRKAAIGWSTLTPLRLVTPVGVTVK